MEDIVIIGAGAAGLYCAYALGRIGRKALVIEKGEKLARKLAVSGGGHANFTNENISAAHYLCQWDETFCEPALRNVDTAYAVQLVRNLGCAVQAKSGGRLFLRGSAAEFVSRLTGRITRTGGKINLAEEALSVKAERGGFHVLTSRRSVRARNVVLALGSPARPDLAQWKHGWLLAARLGHKYAPPKPALVRGVYKDAQSSLRQIAGIAVEVALGLQRAGLPDKSWRNDLLFTHNGLSGPAFFNASLYWDRETSGRVDFLPGFDLEKALDENPRSTARGILRQRLPLRLIDVLLAEEPLNSKAAELGRQTRRKLASAIHAWPLPPLEPGGLKYAEVCSGGLGLSQIDARTMQSRIRPGLYIIGEMQAVTGELGGYNLHWALASAVTAASSMAANLA